MKDEACGAGYSSAWTLTKSCILGSWTDEIICFVDRTADSDPPPRYYFTKDRLNSTRELINASATVVTSYDYDAWGSPTESHLSGNVSTRYRCSGWKWAERCEGYVAGGTLYATALGRMIVGGVVAAPLEDGLERPYEISGWWYYCASSFEDRCETCIERNYQYCLDQCGPRPLRVQGIRQSCWEACDEKLQTGRYWCHTLDLFKKWWSNHENPDFFSDDEGRPCFRLEHTEHVEEYCYQGNWIEGHGEKCRDYVCYGYFRAALMGGSAASYRKRAVVHCKDGLYWLLTTGRPNFHDSREQCDDRDYHWRYKLSLPLIAKDPLLWTRYRGEADDVQARAVICG